MSSAERPRPNVARPLCRPAALHMKQKRGMLPSVPGPGGHATEARFYDRILTESHDGRESLEYLLESLSYFPFLAGLQRSMVTRY